MAPEQAAALTEFARTVKAAARAVSLYPSTHPAIQGALGRVVAASRRLTAGGDVMLVVHPDSLVIGGRAAARPDPAIGELAELLHERLVGNLRVHRDTDTTDWQAFLPLLARAPEDLIAEGGIGKVWTLTGRGHFEIREIDYADLLRERAGGESAEWDRIIAHCMRSDVLELDERALALLTEIAGDRERFGELLQRLQASGEGDAKASARAAALLRIVRILVATISARAPDDLDRTLRSMAAATSKLTPDMMLALLAQAEQRDAGTDGAVVGQIVDRIGDRTVAAFVAGNIIAERGATGRLAQAFEALVPETDRRRPILDQAREEVAESSLGTESGFEELWQNAAGMLMSYSDKPFVSAEYARELSGARTQAIEIERISDDPPDRIRTWLATVADKALRELDIQLLLDLLRLEPDPAQWRAISTLVVGEIERLTALGEFVPAQQLLQALAHERGAEGRAAFSGAAAHAIEKLAAGPLVRHLVVHLRKVHDRDVASLNRLVLTLGPGVIRPLAEALAEEENKRALSRLREMLLAFGAAGRQSVERLKHSANPAVRRTAIELLRVFGGREALPELASMLDDADPHVQREAIRAIVQMGTEEAFAVLERALVGSQSQSRDTILQHLLGLRDDKAVPLLCYVLDHTQPRGKLVNVHLAVIEALGALNSHPESMRALKEVLYRGTWWAPFRTAALRQAAAAALRRLGSAEARDVLQEAATSRRRGVRSAARAQIG
jgi:hypothetical protein